MFSRSYLCIFLNALFITSLILKFLVATCLVIVVFVAVVIISYANLVVLLPIFFDRVVCMGQRRARYPFYYFCTCFSSIYVTGFE